MTDTVSCIVSSPLAYQSSAVLVSCLAYVDEDGEVARNDDGEGEGEGGGVEDLVQLGWIPRHLDVVALPAPAVVHVVSQALKSMEEVLEQRFSTLFFFFLRTVFLFETPKTSRNQKPTLTLLTLTPHPPMQRLES